MDERAAIEGSNNHDAAVLVGALARLQSATTEMERLRDGRFLVSALPQLKPEEIFGEHIYYVIGKAYETVGLAKEKAMVYQKAIQRGVARPVEDRMRLDLASYHGNTGEPEDAIDMLEPVISAPNPGALWRGALFKKASLLLALDQPVESRGICRQLLDSSENELEKRQLLRVMGQAYEAERDYENAARCFAGLIPAPSSPAHDDASLSAPN